MLVGVISLFEKDRAYIVRNIKAYNGAQNQSEEKKKRGYDIAQTVLGKKKKKSGGKEESETEKLAEAVNLYHEEREEDCSELLRLMG